MKKLTDVYIKVSTRNREALSELLNMPHLRVGLYIVFNADSIENANIWETIPNHKQNVTLRDLKRLVESIPTREEIKLLKQQNRALTLNHNKAKDVMERMEANIKGVKWTLGGISGRMIKTNQYGGFVADVDTKANALLISKAPEMLQLLNNIHGEIMRTDGILDVQKWGDKIEQLIKEATEL